MSEATSPALSGPIQRTFFYYAGASAVGLVAITTTSLVDGAFVGNYVGAHALAAISLLIPCFTVLYAVALMFAIGGSVYAGQHIGAGDADAASDVFSQTLLATLAVAVLFALGSSALEAPLLRALSVPSQLAPLASEYLGVIRWVFVVQLTTMVLYYFVRADGHPLLATGALVTGAATNVAFNAWFVAFLGWGLAGAAFGTALAQLVQAAVLCRYFTSPERTLRFAARQTRWLQLLKASYAGAAEFINEVSAGAIIWCINALLLARMGVEGVAAFGVVNYYVFASLMLAYGISDALHLLVSQNYGAGRRERIRAFADTALRCALILGVLLAALFVGARGPLARWFLDAGETSITELAGRLCLIVWPLFVVSSANIALSCYLTAIQQPGPSASIALLRGLFLPLALLWSLARLSEPGPGGLGLPNWSFLLALPLAEWLTFGWAMFLRHRFRPEALDLQPETEPSGPPTALAIS